MGPDQEKSFTEIKQELTKPTVLALYNPQAETKGSANASSFGLGGCVVAVRWSVVEACGIRLKITLRHGKKICSNREGNSSHNMGL